jgi:hypothetical protein
VTQREHLAKLMDLLVAHRAKIHYRQLRPMATAKIHHELMLRTILNTSGLSMDCSESVTLLCRLAGLRDPNGRGYDGYGYTGTLLQHLGEHAYPPSKAKVAGIGALVVFGGGTGEHVCMVRNPGEDPVLFSHGQESGPFWIKLSEEERYHSGPTRFLPITSLLT